MSTTNIEEAIAAQMPILRQHLERSLSPHIPLRYPVDDLVNDTMLRALENLDSFEYRSQTSLGAWLQRIASRLVIDDIRRKQSHQINGAKGSQIYKALTQSGELTPSKECSAHEAVQFVVQAMGVLSDHHRQVIQLRYVDGLDFAAISESLDRSPEAVRGLHRNALKELRQELGRASLYFSG